MVLLRLRGDNLWRNTPLNQLLGSPRPRAGMLSLPAANGEFVSLPPHRPLCRPHRRDFVERDSRCHGSV